MARWGGDSGQEREQWRPFQLLQSGSTRVSGHPLRVMRDLTNAALTEMLGQFEALCSRSGRSGIAPEKLLRALLLQTFYSIQSERQLMEQLEFNLLSRWFVGLGIDDRVWDATVFCRRSTCRWTGADRGVGVDCEIFRAVDEEPPGEDGDGDGAVGGRNAAREFHRVRWSNETHPSTTDDDCRL